MNFSYESNAGILDLFFDREAGESNLIRLAPHKVKLLMEHCNALISDNDMLRKHIAFYSILDLLTKGGFSDVYKNVPDDVRRAIDYINENLSSEINVKKLAQVSHVTENTLTRHFNASIGISPYAYIKNLRFSHAFSALEKGASVTEAAVSSGFSDYSHFIAEFKKRYGKTPHQIKKDIK
jgi:AraC-like DNA-binding protein